MHTLKKSMIKSYVLVLFYPKLNLKYSSASFSPNQKYNQLPYRESGSYGKLAVVLVR